MSLYLPIWYGRRFWLNRKNSIDFAIKDASQDGPILKLDTNEDEPTNFGQSKSDHIKILKIAAIICPMWFLSNLLYNYSLLMTSVSSSTIIR